MRLVFTQRAKKDFIKLDQLTQKRIQTALDRMLFSPESMDIKKLKGEQPPLWRLRVGDYRIIMSINKENAVEIVSVLYIKHRREIYR